MYSCKGCTYDNKCKIKRTFEQSEVLCNLYIPKKQNIGSQCNGCTEFLNDKCQRISKKGIKGVCWMSYTEGEY